jgi:signal transduction histidine kinase
MEELRLRLEEAEQTLEAIRKGQVDSLVVEGPDGLRVYALEGTSNSYRVLVEAMNEGAATLNGDGVILYSNGRLARMLATPLQRVMGSALHDFVPPRFHETLDALLRSAGGGESRTELTLLAGEEEVPAYLSFNEIDDGRRVLCLVATDLRAQKRNEEIVAAEQLARSVLEQAADAIVVCDEGGRVIRASRAAAELCGRNPLLVPFEEAFPLALGVDVGPGGAAAAALAGRTLRAAPATLARGDAGSAELLVSAAPLQGARARVIGCVVTLVDVTEHRRAEEALREADRRKNQFMATLSHELRNPLAPIQNSLYLLAHAEPGGDQARRAQAVIERQIAQLARLVDDLLDVTRISNNRVGLKYERLELNDLVRRTVDDYRTSFEQGGVHLQATLAPDPLFVSGDSARLSQVIGNLLQNAAKFTPRGGSARISVAPEMSDGPWAAIRVADSGAGIATDMLARIFEPFTQVDRTLDRSMGGLGLGLSLVKGFVELHGGTVSAHSEGPGRGSEFAVRLPIAGAAEPRAAAPPEVVTGRRRILVVEDNADAAHSLRDVLELSGHVVEVANEGPTALAKARDFRPDLVLCDIGLPGMDGYAVARAFRSDPALAHVHLVALSGYARPEDLQLSAEAGFERHVAKPANPDALDELLGTL